MKLAALPFGLATSILAGLVTFTASTTFAQDLDNSTGAIEMSDQGNTPPPPQRETTGGQPRVGRKAAERYMTPRQNQAQDTNTGGSSYRGEMGPNDHYLAIHAGGFIDDTAYKWGSSLDIEDAGKWNFGVTYRVGEWTNSMDLLIRVDVLNYDLGERSATKLSFLPVVTFPDASSKFPLYFGAGLGLGIFAKQIPDESALSFDYQILAGARFFEVFGNMGFFVEAGLKNHLLLLSDGQFNGTFATVGTVFTF